MSDQRGDITPPIIKVIPTEAPKTPGKPTAKKTALELTREINERYNSQIKLPIANKNQDLASLIDIKGIKA